MPVYLLETISHYRLVKKVDGCAWVERTADAGSSLGHAERYFRRMLKT